MNSQTSLWSDPQTWGGTLPKSGDVINIPKGKTVVLDVNPPSLGGLMIHGTLIFDDTKDLFLTSEYIIVMGPESHLRIGSETDPFTHKAIITLTGSDRTKNIMGEGLMSMGSKTLATMGGGSVAIHGHRRDAVSWTQLSANAKVGDTQMQLATAVDWRVGDEIVIAPSGFDPYEAEKVTVTGVSGNTVLFAPALKYEHWGELQSYEGQVVDERAEVGLLTRDIVIQGDENSVEGYNDTYGYHYGFGGHVMLMAGGTARVEGVEFRRMGQTKILARYPIHWHLAGDREGDYARFNSIHESFQRGIVTHGTGKVLIEGNVAYNVLNHIFMPAEEGTLIESGNRYLNNLGILARQIENIHYARPNGIGDVALEFQDQDRISVFWMPQPNQTLIGNHAVGSIRGQGFFYSGPGDVAPADIAIDFKDNVAHTIGPFKPRLFNYPPNAKGFGLFVSGELSEDNPPRQQLFKNFLAYKNGVAGIWAEDSDTIHVFEAALLADNVAGFMTMAGGTLKNSLVIGQTENSIGDDLTVEGTHRAAGYHTIRQQGRSKKPRLDKVTFINQRGGALNTEALEGGFSQDIKLVNTQPIVYHTFSEGKPEPYPDLDGSLTGADAPAMVHSPFEHKRLDGNCAYMPHWNCYVCMDDGAPTPVGTQLKYIAGADGFESNTADLGFGWNGPWKSENASITDNYPLEGVAQSHLMLEIHSDGSATRSVNLNEAMNAKLQFWWKAKGNIGENSAQVAVNDGSGWITVKELSITADWVQEEISLQGLNMGANFQIRFSTANLNGRDNALWIDNVFVLRDALANDPNFDVAPDDVFVFFPNPFSDFVNINWPENEDRMKVRVFNVLGQLLRESGYDRANPAQLFQEIDLKGIVSTGHYILEARFGSGTRFAARVIKE